MKLFDLATDLIADADVLRRRRYGAIEMVRGELRAVHLRPWPRVVSLLDVEWFGPRWRTRNSGDRCWVYYHQPLGHSRFLALSYVLSSVDCRLATFHGGLQVLDEIARLKRSDALVCDAWNSRISDRLLARWGWQPHASSRWHRNHIKRFYGQYPQSRFTPVALRNVLAAECSC